VTIVHARSYVSAVIALLLKKLTGVRFIFDMRGFWADERVDGGIWPGDGRMYRVAKWFEKQFLRNADHVISLTRAAAREMLAFDFLRERRPELTVIPTCADLSTFSVRGSRRRGPGFVLGYVGSAGTWYLFDEVVACFQQLLQMRAGSRFLIVNRGQHAFIRERLTHAGVPEDSFDLVTAKHAEVPAHMARMDAGIFFYKPTFSRLATAPTKLGEFLGCGVPCLSNVGVGDMAAILEGDRVGVALDAFDQRSIRHGLQRMLDLCGDESTRARCVEAAQKYFSLNEGVRLYGSVYAGLETAPRGQR
jgi:glycosyltransferase involved in cell wall biosynthesis